MLCPTCATELPGTPPRFCPTCSMAVGTVAPESPAARIARCRECGLETERSVCPNCGQKTGVEDGADGGRFVPSPQMSGLREIELADEGGALELDTPPADTPRR